MEDLHCLVDMKGIQWYLSVEKGTHHPILYFWKDFSVLINLITVENKAESLWWCQGCCLWSCSDGDYIIHIGLFAFS